MNAGVAREEEIIQTIGNGIDALTSYMETHRIDGDYHIIHDLRAAQPAYLIVDLCDEVFILSDKSLLRLREILCNDS